MGVISKWESIRIRYLCVMCGNDLFYFYGSLDLLNAEGSRRSQVRYRIAINKNPVFEPKVFLSILWSLDACNKLNLICFLIDQMTLLIICYYYWLQHVFVYLLEREYPVIFVYFLPQALRFKFYRYQTHFLICIFLKWLLWVFKRERMSLPSEKGLQL